jgi:DNA primase large subunit
MTPQQAAALVGHSPDIVERLGARADEQERCNSYPIDRAMDREAAAEIERLRTALRSVREILRQARCQTDLSWSEQLVSDALEIISNALRETKP